MQAQDGKNIIYRLLCEYYGGEIFKGVEIGDATSETYLKLEERPSGILESLNKLMPLELNINDETAWTPLMMSVMNLDYYMTEYLIQNGANPCFWHDREEEIREQKLFGLDVDNYYLVDIDIHIMNDIDLSEEKVTSTILNLARIILEFEGVNSFFGYCLKADKENRVISVDSFKTKY